MPVSDVLKSFRKEGYNSPKEEDKKESAGGPRLIKLTDDEVKSLAGGEGGEEITCEVTGRLSGSEFSVTSVRSSGGGEEDGMAEKVMGMMQQAPVMRPQTMPSPS